MVEKKPTDNQKLQKQGNGNAKTTGSSISNEQAPSAEAIPDIDLEPHDENVGLANDVVANEEPLESDSQQDPLTLITLERDC